MSDSLQHARFPCPWLSPRVCSHLCPLSQWCYLTILSSAALFTFCLQSSLASGSFPMSWLFTLDGQSCSFSFSISPSNEYSGLISFRIDGFDLLAVQWILKSLLQHNSKVSILQHSAFFMVQLLHPYMTTGKIIGLIIQTFVGKVMLLNMLSRLVIAFLPRSKCLLISWLQSLSTVILEPKKIKSVPVFTFSP